MRTFSCIGLWLLCWIVILPQRASAGPNIVDLGKGRQPRLAFGNADAVYAVFGDGGVQFLQSGDGGKTWSAPLAIKFLAGKMPLGMRRGPRISAVSDAIIVTAVTGKKGGGADGDLVAVRSIDGGRTWSNPIVISDVPAAAREGLDGLASDGHDHLAAVWLDLRDGKTTLMSSISADRGASWSANVLVYRSPDGHICECCHPSAVFEPDGKIDVLFRNWLGGNRDMYVASSADSGKTWTPATRLGQTSWPLDACPMDGGEIGFFQQKVVAGWMRDSRVYLSAGLNTSERKADEGHQPTLAVSATGIWLAYIKNGDLWVAPEVGKSFVLAKNANDPVLEGSRDHVICAWESAGRSFSAILK